MTVHNGAAVGTEDGPGAMGSVFGSEKHRTGRDHFRLAGPPANIWAAERFRFGGRAVSPDTGPADVSFPWAWRSKFAFRSRPGFRKIAGPQRGASPEGIQRGKKTLKKLLWRIDGGAVYVSLLVPLAAGSELIGVVLVHFGTAN